jgi:hypothetical protein
MVRVVARRLVWTMVILFAIATITFLLERVVPANPAAFLAGQNAPAETVERIKVQYGLDKPIPVQYVTYVSGLVQGDLGVSFRTRRAVSEDLIQFLPATLELLFVSFAVYVALSLALGIVAAQMRGRLADRSSASRRWSGRHSRLLAGARAPARLLLPSMAADRRSISDPSRPARADHRIPAPRLDAAPRRLAVHERSRPVDPSGGGDRPEPAGRGRSDDPRGLHRAG